MGFGFLVWKSAGFLGHREQGICEMGFQCLRERERGLKGSLGFFGGQMHKSRGKQNDGNF